MFDQFSALLLRLQHEFRRLSTREKAIIVGALTIGLIMAGNRVITTVRDGFEDQQVRLQAAKTAADETTSLVTAYRAAALQQREIKQRYSRLGRPEGALSYLETTTRQKVGVNPSIEDLTPRPFGGQFEQLPFRIKFQSNDLAKIADLLKELTGGRQRYLLTELEITPRGGDLLDVMIDLSSIAPKEAPLPDGQQEEAT